MKQSLDDMPVQMLCTLVCITVNMGIQHKTQIQHSTT